MIEKTGGRNFMPLTDWERGVLKELREWEKKLLGNEANDFQVTYENYLERAFYLLPKKIQASFFSVIDTWLFHIHSIIHGSQMQIESRDRILSAGRMLNHRLEKITDLKTLKLDQLQYIADQQIAKHRFYSLTQGGLSGIGNAVFVGTDIPAMVIINLRAVQQISMIYGFELNTPYEMMTSLKVFHTAILPPKHQKEAWMVLVNELKNDHYFFYEGNENIADISMLEPIVQQILKTLVIQLFRKKLIQGIPLVGMAIGARANYQFTRKVTDFAHKYYQLRFLTHKEVGNNEYSRT
jgi:hypothetical protein